MRSVPTAFAALLLALVPVASAAKGGNPGKPGGGGGSTTTSGTLYASCNPCAVDTVAQFWGSGYDASQAAAQLYVSGGRAAIPVYSDGTVSFAWNLSAPGTYDVRVYQKGKGKNKLVMKGEVVVVAQ